MLALAAPVQSAPPRMHHEPQVAARLPVVQTADNGVLERRKRQSCRGLPLPESISPRNQTMSAEGLIYVADTNNHCIRTVQPADATVSIFCGKGKEAGCVNGPAAEARFNWPTGLVLDMNENLIIADCFNNCVRKVTLPDGRATTVAGGALPSDFGRRGSLVLHVVQQDKLCQPPRKQ